MSELDGALAAALEAIQFKDDPRYIHGSWRLILRGPWHMAEGPQWTAVAEPHNATGNGYDHEIEAVGPTLTSALYELAIACRKDPA